MSAIRVFHVSSSYPPSLGGMEKVVQILAETQSNSGTNVTVLTSNKGVKKPSTIERFSVIRLRSFIIANTTVMPSLFIVMLLKVKRTSVVHVHITQAYTPEMVWIASKFKGFRYVAHIHLDVPPSGHAGFLLKPYKSLLLKRVLHSAAYVVVFSEDQKEHTIKKYKITRSKVKVIPNGVEEKFYYNKPRKIHKKTRLLFVGRLSIQKNIEQLLQALDGISDQFETNIVGDGEQEKALKKLAKNLKLQNINFDGRADGQKLLDFYKQADIFVLPSEREGMPLVLLEAMAMGLPIVATDVTGNRDVVISGKNGLLAGYGDIDGYRAALLKIATNTFLYSSFSKSACKMSKDYSWIKVSEKFQKLYDGVIV